MTTVKYDKPIADFIAGLNKTGHVTHVKYKKTSVTFHHNGGRLSLQGILDVWKTRPASAHFQSDRNGALGQYVDVHEYAWATGNTTGNKTSISIEMANETVAPNWTVADATWKSAARLAGWLFANEIEGKPRPSKSNVHFHKFWKSTDCAGPYMDKIYTQLLAEVQKWYDYFKNGTQPSTGGELSMSDVQRVLDYQKACAEQIQENTKQLVATVTKSIMDYQRVCTSQITENTRQIDAVSDKQVQDQLKALEDSMDAQLQQLHDMHLPVPNPEPAE